MNTDIRLSVNFFNNPKTVKLKRRLGADGVINLLTFWLWVASNRPNGDLRSSNGRSTDVKRKLNEEDIEIAACWNGEEKRFVSVLLEVGFLDKMEDGYVVHDWEEHNSWASKAEKRGNEARFARLAGINVNLYNALKEQGITGLTAREYNDITNGRSTDVKRTLTNGSTPTPTPTPTPSPTPMVIKEVSGDATPPPSCSQDSPDVKNGNDQGKKKPEKREEYDFSAIPPEINKETVLAFLEHRKKIKSPATQRALKTTCKFAMQIAKTHNMNPNDVIDYTIARGWQTCDPKWECWTKRVGAVNGGQNLKTRQSLTPRQQYMKELGDLLDDNGNYIGDIGLQGNDGHALPSPRIGAQRQNPRQISGRLDPSSE